MSNAFEIQPIGRFVGQSAAIKRPRVCLNFISPNFVSIVTGQDELRISTGINVQWVSQEMVDSGTKGICLIPMTSLP